jgi:hypothetical protein
MAKITNSFAFEIVARFGGLLVLLIFGLLLPPQICGQKSAARAEALKFQQEREAEFRDPKKSALPPEEIPNFKGLTYFPINTAYRVTARFVRTPDEAKFDMPTSNPQKQKRHVKYGELHFTLRGRKLTLNVYQNEALSQQEKYKDYLFLPFNDATNGKQTYGGGRYIDLKIPEGDTITLDFNHAYQPNCAYDHTTGRWSCPIPPRENRLKVAIRAGEKMPSRTPKPENANVKSSTCFNPYNINLGDRFSTIDSYLSLQPDPNGPNENINWIKGKKTDFYTTSLKTVRLDQRNTLNAVVYATFNDRQGLTYLSVSWTLDGEDNDAAKLKVLHWLRQHKHPCLPISVKANPGSYPLIIERDSAVAEFTVANGFYWSVSYTLKAKP